MSDTEPLLTKATRILSNAYYGEHHIPGKIKDLGRIVECNVFDSISTYDSNTLTRLVIAAHDECIRMEIRSSGPGRLKLLFTGSRKRPEECGDYPLMHGHVTIEDAIKVYRNRKRHEQYPGQWVDHFNQPAEGVGRD